MKVFLNFLSDVQSIHYIRATVRHYATIEHFLEKVIRYLCTGDLWVLLELAIEHRKHTMNQFFVLSCAEEDV